MGYRTTSLAELLELLYELDRIPHEAWAYNAIRRGLSHPDPDLRELAIGAATTAVMLADLQDHARTERTPWLARFAALAAADLACAVQ